MKKLFFLCLMGLLIHSIGYCKDKQESSYYQELQTFKENPEFQAIFDEEAPDLACHIHRDIQNFKELSYWQRLSRFLFLSEDVVAVTPSTMPKLYAYVESTCNKQGLAIPTIFITREKGIFNAFAAKLFATTGGIAIHQKIIEDTSDVELEAVIAHELGHIKHNHSNQILARAVPLYLAALVGMSYARTMNPVYTRKNGVNFIELICRHVLASSVAGFLTQLTIGKQFEKEADEFSYKEVGNGQGLIEFFKHLQEKEKYQDAAFDGAYEALQKNKPALSDHDYQAILIDYYVAKGIHKGFKWVYYNTPMGPHPSPEARQKAVEEYLASKP